MYIDDDVIVCKKIACYEQSASKSKDDDSFYNPACDDNFIIINYMNEKENITINKKGKKCSKKKKTNQ